MKRKSIPALIAILQISSFAFGQQPNPTPPVPPPTAQRPATVPRQPAADGDDVVRITTKLVQVDAVVTDNSGKPVNDLRPEEIQIFEDGRRQTVTHFSYVAASANPTNTSIVGPAAAVDKNALPAPVPTVTLRPEQVRRSIALVVDDLGLSFESMQFVRQALKKFVDEQMQPGDLVAIIRTGGGIGALQQFTADKRRLYAAIERVRWNPFSRAGANAVPRIESSPIADALRADLEAEAAAFLANADHLREDAIAVGTLGSLRYVVRGLGELPGRKSLLLMSDGIRVFRPDDRDASQRVLLALQRLADLANRAAVAIYSLDARGLQPLAQTAADQVRIRTAISGVRTPIQTQVAQQLGPRTRNFYESQNGLNYLSEQTGGLFVRNRNDLNDGIRRIMEDQKGYYLIGYRPDDSTFDPKTGGRKFHALTLKVTRRGKFNTRMRKGFYGVTDAESTPELRTASQQVVNALTSPFGAAGVHLRLTSAFSNDAQLGSLLSSMLHVRGSDLTFTDEPDGWHKAEFDIVAITYGDNGAIVDRVGRTHSMRIGDDSYQSVLKEGFVYLVTVPVTKPGPYQLRVALRDHGTEQVGSASQFVEVPDLTKNQLTLSGVLVHGVEPAALHKKEAGTNANSQKQASPNQNGERAGVNDSTNAAAVRRLHRGAILQYGFAIYNARLDKATGRPQLKIKVRILRDGLPVFTGQEEAFELTNQPDLKRLGASGGILLGSQMAPGEYVFQVIVTDLLADRKQRLATQWMDFEIVK